MPSILKHFLGPVSDYVFPEAEDLPVEDPPMPQEDQESAQEEPPTEEETAAGKSRQKIPALRLCSPTPVFRQMRL